MKHLLILFILIPILSFAQKKYPSDIEVVLKQTKNRIELEKVIDHFSKKKDSVKLQAVYFLIRNMDIQYSQDYYWADSLGKKINYNELDYPDFATSIKAFDSLKIVFPKIHPVPYYVKDLDIIKSDFLIQTINSAFEIWVQPWATQTQFDLFCEYLLPYRISVEPLQNWRMAYKNKFAFIIDSSKENIPNSSLSYLVKDINKWFTCMYNFEERKDPLARLGSLQLLHRKKGFCEDVGDLAVFALRSQGIPSTVNFVPFWATSSGGHAFNVAFNKDYNPVPFDVLFKSDSLYRLIREPAKVLSTTYSNQKNTLANIVSADKIPAGFLRTKNYKDVTDQYWQTKDVTCELFNKDKSVVYCSVFNYGQWQPAWWGQANAGSVTFTNMCKGAAFLPMNYNKGKLQPAGYPVVSGYNNTLVLKPDTINTHSITIKEQDKYLLFRPGKKYQLFYWNNKWKIVKEQTYTSSGSEDNSLVFDNVPKNALLLLVPEYSQHKERPFIILDDGTRLWW